MYEDRAAEIQRIINGEHQIRRIDVKRIRRRRKLKKWLLYLLSIASMGVGGYFVGKLIEEPLAAYALVAIFFVALSVTLSFEANHRT